MLTKRLPKKLILRLDSHYEGQVLVMTLFEVRRFKDNPFFRMDRVLLLCIALLWENFAATGRKFVHRNVLDFDTNLMTLDSTDWKQGCSSGVHQSLLDLKDN